jgi:hypothetical protein
VGEDRGGKGALDPWFCGQRRMGRCRSPGRFLGRPEWELPSFIRPEHLPHWLPGHESWLVELRLHGLAPGDESVCHQAQRQAPARHGMVVTSPLVSVYAMHLCNVASSCELYYIVAAKFMHTIGCKSVLLVQLAVPS